MSISLKTHKMLWGRAGSRCSFCRRELVEDAVAINDASLVGEECHIVARSDDGPRGDSTMLPAQRDNYDNLILLCNIHHKQVDDQPSTYDVDRLRIMKAEHEQWVRGALQGFDPDKQRDDEYYAWLIDEWALRSNLEGWDRWTSWLLGSGWPRLRKVTYTQLDELRKWLFMHVWPERYPGLNAAFENYLLVLTDLCEVFDSRREAHPAEPEEFWSTQKFYKAREYTQRQYDWLSREYDFHVDLVQDLALELTRAANYVCDQIRRHLDPWYRLRDGVLTVTTGPNERLQYTTLRVNYRPEERALHPYPGLEAFKTARATRDVRFGKDDRANSKPFPPDIGEW